MKILVAIDGTECSKMALDNIVKRSWSSTDQFMIVSIVEPLDDLCDQSELEDNYLDEMIADCSKIVKKAVGKMQSILKTENISSEVLKGSAAEQIVQCASDWDADLIVLGSHGHSDCRRFLPGSVAEKVLKQSPCSVEVVKQKHSPVAKA